MTSDMVKEITKATSSDEKCSSNRIDKGGRSKHCHDQEGGSFETSSSPPNRRGDSATLQQEDRLKSARDQMGQVKEENEKLKSLLSQVVNDYQSLQTQFFDVFRQEHANYRLDSVASPSPASNNKAKAKEGEEEEEAAELSLTLGRTSSMPLFKNNSLKDGKNDGQTLEKELSLGFECRYEKLELMEKQAMKNGVANPGSLDEYFQEAKEEEPTATWPPSKVLKTMKGSDDEVVLQQPQLKKARVSIRVRCDTPTMNDGCQWRKYGQKLAKGNPCPRAYYRCTVSPSCPVRKQVQRCSKDMSILITTYEGNHNHPLPITATAMASTTSAAASMLQSHSITSHSSSNTSSTSISSSPNLYGMDFNRITQNAKHQAFFPNSTISTCNSHPTITLDLTAPPAKSSQFNNIISSNFHPKNYSPCLHFSPSTPSPSFLSNWNYITQPISEYHLYQSYNPMNATHATLYSQSSLTDTLATTTKVLASDSSFQTALATALTTFVGNGTTSSIDDLVRGGSSTLAMKWLGSSSLENSSPLTSEGNGVACATNYSCKTMGLNSQQQRSFINLFPPTLSLPISSKSASTSSPSNNKDDDKVFAYSNA